MISKFLNSVLGRIPLGWLQLRYNKMRLAAAVAGVAFANVLVFVQLGLMGALNGTIGMSYQLLDGDIIMSASDANTLVDGGNVARTLLYQSLSVEGVKSGVPVYVGNIDWTRPDGNTVSLQIVGVNPEYTEFVGKNLAGKMAQLKMPNTVLLDDRTRGVKPGDIIASSEKPLSFETRGTTLDAIGTFSLGGGFSSDGYMLSSDQTFLQLFPQRKSGAPNHLLFKILPTHNVESVVKNIKQRIDMSAVKVRSLGTAIADDTRYQTTERPTGVIFGFGVFIGILVGIVIVYQVLATDVADHLKEYATFKAMGYGNSFFVSVIVEEAVLLATLGFVPGTLLALLIYFSMSSATGLPVEMSVLRMSSVLFGTIIACVVSGLLAARRLTKADPADLF